MEFSVDEIKKVFPDWNPTTPEQEKMLELMEKAHKALQEFGHPDPIQD